LVPGILVARSSASEEFTAPPSRYMREINLILTPTLKTALLCSYKTRIYIPYVEKRSFLNSVLILGAFAKLRKATISFVVFFCPSVRVEQLGFHWKDFHEILYLDIFRKYFFLPKLAIRDILHYLYELMRGFNGR
jgi:hypothetical protein